MYLRTLCSRVAGPALVVCALSLPGAYTAPRGDDATLRTWNPGLARSTAATLPPAVGSAATDPGGTPLILAANEGERRVRRTLGGARLTLKVDPVTARSPEFVMITEAIPPGEGIPPHVHPSADEIIFIHGGSGAVELGSRSAPVTAGATVYIPRSTRIAIRNTGTDPLVILAIFSRTGFESYLRDTSVPEGQPVVPLTPAEMVAIRQRHVGHAVFERR
jgi:mannose-6-phosphate isomerase-like protein (cupin superfamily)